MGLKLSLKPLEEDISFIIKPTDELTYDDLKEENQKLKEKLDKYENPEDMTLFAMWCTEKVKEENQKLQTIANNCKQLKDNWDELKEWLEEKWEVSQDIWFVKIINKMKELEKGDIND